jgi:hypothetical protein
MHTDTGIPNNYGNDLKELKLMIVNLEVFLQGQEIILNYLVFWGGIHRYGKEFTCTYGNCFLNLIIFRPRIKHFKLRWRTSN